MRILLLGKYGQLGWELQRSLAPLGEVLAYDYPEIDLARPQGLPTLIREARPQVIVNATAYTAVDRAESEAEVAQAINADAPGLLAAEAARLGAAFIHYSTDYVFDGCKGAPYTETDLPNPLGVYGRSKLAGEQLVQQAGGNCLIFRTSWVYSLRRDSFVTKVLQWARHQPTMRLVSDQVGNPTWARMLAEVTGQLLALAGGGRSPHSAPVEASPILSPSPDNDGGVVGWLGERRGLYHLAGSGFATRLEWGQAILQYDPKREEQRVTEIIPARTADFSTPAQRPLFSALDCACFTETFGLRLPEWQDALRLAMEWRAGSHE